MMSLEEIAEKVNAWCDERRLVPANGQAAEAITTRTLRYYRTMGLMDGTKSTGGRAFTERHLLQALAVRVLQAQGLPLSRIQTILHRKDDAELRTIIDRVSTSPADELSRFIEVIPVLQREQPAYGWKVWTVGDDFLLLAKNDKPNEDKLERIKVILAEDDIPF